jgi:uncharacterized membrane protein YeaQ/YmgE (transglycosylase-associated protein family)
MGITALLIATIIGAIAGLASQLVQGTGLGLLLDVLVGIVGAFMAILLLPFIKLDIGGDIIGLIIEATLGAVFLLYIVRQIRA